MSNEIILIRESFRVPMMSGMVTVATIEVNADENSHQYMTTVSWAQDDDLAATFKAASREEALEKHEKLTRPFKKYKWFWKPVPETNSMQMAIV